MHRIHRGVYAVGHPRLDQEGLWMAAVLACGKESVLSHTSAAELWALLQRGRGHRIHLSVRTRSVRNVADLAIHAPRSLERCDCTVRRGIPVTTATRTVWDLASTLPPLQVRRAFEQAEKLHLLDRPRLAQLREATPNRRGGALIATLLAEGALPLDRTRSWLEELLLTICRDNSLPLPAVNVPLLGYEVDFLWPQHRFVVEADGGHHLGPAQRDRDNERDIAFARAGYLVRRYGARAMGDGRAVAAEILGILRERTPARRLSGR